MRLLKFSYKESSDWSIQDLQLQIVNLLVGQNGTGKSKTLYQLGRFVKILTQQINELEKEEWVVEFVTKDNQLLTYKLATLKTKVVEEYLFLNNEPILERKKGDNFFRIRKNKEHEWTEYSPPLKKLAISSIRDILKYPYTEEILNWAENSYGFEFSYEAKFDFKRDFLNLTTPTADLFNELNKKQRNNVIKELNQIGFKIAEIEIIKDKGDMIYLLLDEKDVKIYINQFNLSQGMARALSLLIHIEYLISRKNPATIIVDDFGEGLDFIRAKELGRLIFDRCLKNKVQLIATSNDSFLMEVIDIEYWNILQRKGSVVSVLNKKNHSKLFENFKFTGLSNFDFFSSDYIPSHL